MKYIIRAYPVQEKPSIIEDFYSKLSKTSKSKIIRQLKYLEEYGLDSSVINLKKLKGYDFWEIRILGKENIRLFVWGILKHIYILHIFSKKSQKTNLNDLNMAKKRLAEIKSNMSIDK